MAIPWALLAQLGGMAAAGAGGLLNARSQNRAAKQQNDWQQQMAQMFGGMMQQGPSQNMQWGQNWLQNFNSQDGGLQSLRTDGAQRSDDTLRGIASGNQGFDNTELFRALGVMDQRATDRAVADTRAGASGLGQRFGTAMMRQEGDMRGQANEAAAARNAQIAMGSHQNQLQNQLAALGMLTGREQFGEQMGMQNQAHQLGLLQMLLGAEQGQQGMNAQLGGAMAGMGPVSGPGYGGAMAQMGMLPFMWQLMQGRGGQRGQQAPNAGPAWMPPFQLQQNPAAMQWGGGF